MNWILFISMLFGLQLFCLVVGSKVSKGLKTNQDYFLASKTVRFFPLMMTLVATQVGGGMVLGSSQEAFTYGWSVLLYPLGQSLGFILLALGIGKKMAESGASTVAELCERVFGSRKLRQCASILSIISLFMIFVAQVIATRKFMVSLGFDETWIFLAFWSLVVIYTVVGGLKAVIYTDLVQAVYFIIVFIVAFIVAQGGSFTEVVEKSSNLVFGGDPSPKMLGWLVMPMLFMAIEQDMGQRCFAADSPKTIGVAAFFAALLTFSVCVIPVYFGVLARILNIEVAPGGSAFMSVIQAVTNPSITALIACAVLAAIISTADSLINAISSNLTQDFNWPFESKEGSVTVARVITTLIAVFGILCSYYFDNIVNVLILSYDLSVSCLLVPVLVALLRKKGNVKSAWLSFLAGAIAFFLFRFIPYEVPKEILCILISLAAFILGEIIFNKKEAVV